jgi:ADP-ribosylglycohydrolase
VLIAPSARSGKAGLNISVILADALGQPVAFWTDLQLQARRTDNRNCFNCISGFRFLEIP